MKDFGRKFVASFYLVPLCFVIATAGSVLYLVREPPVFSAHARIEHRSNRDPNLSAMTTESRIEEVTHRLNRPREEVARNLRELQVRPFSNTHVLDLRVTALGPDFAADFANAWADVITSNASSKEYELIETAKPNTKPVSPKKGLVLLLAMTAGLLTGLSLTTVIASMQSSRTSAPQRMNHS